MDLGQVAKQVQQDPFWEELKRAFEEVQVSYRKGNAPRLGAALCDLEFHTKEALQLLEKRFPFFRAGDFRRVVARNHHGCQVTKPFIPAQGRIVVKQY